MVEPQPSSRTTGLVRVLGVLVLLAGIVAMHAGVFAVAPADDHHTMATMALPVDHNAAAGPDCTDDGCGHAHGGMHACVFILTAGAVALMLVLLYWITLDRPGGGMSKPRQWRPIRECAPPWTVPSLAELSILRI
ncbi:DUF6153 family protein [Nocardia vinacea]|uniref:DUF6153 family protein n=1 Tax=Nocardia vinacea TaxID=96468 RepID=A0ABZ1Z462_9NOCA|nr:DUF6153 family protein [Nocardia vinacea]